MYKNIVFILLCVILVSLQCVKKDLIDPTVYIIYPTENSSVSGVLRIKAVAMDNIEVTCVEFYINNIKKGVDSTASNSVYEYVWNTTAESKGTKIITAKAFDRAGNLGESPSVIVTIDSIEPSGPTYHSGSITSNELWTKRLSPHIVDGEIQVSALLTIEAGAVIKFTYNDTFPSNYRSKIKVLLSGDIIAQGTSNEPILFTSNQDNPHPRDWKGIQFKYSASELSIFDYCIIDYAETGISIEERTISVKNTLVENCQYDGIESEYSRFREFCNNTLTQNGEFPITISAYGVSSLGLNNYFLGNNNTEYGDVIRVIQGDVIYSGTWRNHGVPYYIYDDIGLSYDNDPSPILIIEPGCILAFDGTQLYCSEETKLIANNVTFTSIYGLFNQGQPGGWQNIIIDNGSVELRNCIIEYASSDEGGGVIEFYGYSDYKSCIVDNCLIKNCEGNGIFIDIYDSDEPNFAQIKNTRITSCTYSPMIIYSADNVRAISSGNDFSGNGFDVIIVAENGDVVNNGIWHNCGVPYLFETDVILQQWFDYPPTITIMPGVIMKFDGSYIKVEQGTLIADGSAGQIVFTADEDVGEWDGIIFDDETNDNLSRLNNCIIEKGGSNNSTRYANIFCYYSAPRITNCEISNSAGWGIALQGSNLQPDTLRRYNRFFNNDSGDVYVISAPDKISNEQKLQIRSTSIRERINKVRANREIRRHENLHLKDKLQTELNKREKN